MGSRVNLHGATARELKLWLYFLQGGRCVLCGQAIDMQMLCGQAIDMQTPRFTYGFPTFEHLVPLSAGGKKGRHNLGLSHWECNRLRRDERRLSIVRPALTDHPKLRPGLQRTEPKAAAFGFNFQRSAKKHNGRPGNLLRDTLEAQDDECAKS